MRLSSSLLMLALATLPGCSDGCNLRERSVKPYRGRAQDARPRGPHGLRDAVSRPPAPEGAPNVVVIVWHAARADRTSLLGYPRDTTPRLAQLGQAGLVFEHAVAPATWSLPATASLLTGVPVTVHGVDEPGDELDDVWITFPELFQQAGWATFAWSTNPWVSDETNLLQGFDVAAQPWVPPWRATAENLVARMGRDPSAGQRDRKINPWQLKDTAELGIKSLAVWLEKRKEPERPFLVFLDLGEAHAPRMPPASALEQVLGAEAVRDASDMTFTMTDQLEWMSGLVKPTKAQRTLVSDRYDATLALLDDLTSQFLATLRADILENAVLVVVGDHGEHLGEEDRWGHPFSLDPALTHVPFVVLRPYGLPHEVVQAPVTTTRLYALLAELAGLPLPPEQAAALDARFERHGAVSEHPPTSERALAALRELAPGADLERLTRHPAAMLEHGGHRLFVDFEGTHRVVDAATGAPVDDPEVTQDLDARWNAWRGELAQRRPRIAGTPRVDGPAQDAPPAAP